MSTQAVNLEPATLRALGMDGLEPSLVHSSNIAAHVYRLAYAGGSGLTGINIGWADMEASTQFLAGIVYDIDEWVADPDVDVESQWDDLGHEICDSAVPIYNHERIAAAEEISAEVDDPGLLGDDLTLANVAGVALYCEAQRIGDALVQAVIEAQTDLEDEAEFAELEALYEKAGSDALTPEDVERIAELEAKQGITQS